MKRKTMSIIICMTLVITALAIVPLNVSANNLILSENFEGSWPPGGWSIHNPGYGTWNTNVYWDRPNYAGSGKCADADSDGAYYGLAGELWTPSFSLVGLSSASLEFNASYNWLGGIEYFAVDVSTDGGVTWTNKIYWQEDHSPDGPAEHVTVDLTPYCGNSNVIIRFVYDDFGGWYWWCQIDDIVISGTPASTSIDVSVDIKPETWPNSLNTQKKGQLPVAICGTDEFDVTTIDPTTIEITREGLSTGVSPLRWSYKDVATPYPSDAGEGWALGADGYLDLCLKFDVLTVATALELDDLVKGDVIPLSITGNLLEEYGSTAIEGYDYVDIIK